VDAEQWAVQRPSELSYERTTNEAQLIGLHHRKFALEMEWATMIDITKARAWAKAITTTINRDGVPCQTFARPIQNMSTTTALLDTLPTPSADWADKVYY
jgi:hypothetical protein